jgi:hypothetical protein
MVAIIYLAAPRLAALSSHATEKIGLLKTTVLLQRLCQRTPPPPRFQNRPRQRPPLGHPKPARSRHPLQSRAQTRQTLAGPRPGRALAIRRQPHAWLPGNPDKQALLDILDDATRLNVGARLYPAETLLAHLDFLSHVFKTHGLPLALYVDFHSFFYTHNPDAFTQLGQALHFYGVKLLYAPPDPHVRIIMCGKFHV